IYRGTLTEWGLLELGINPVARTNVCPPIDPPPEPSFHAFSFTNTSIDAPPSFVVAGAGEVRHDHGGSVQDQVVRRGDVSREGMLEKARHVHGQMDLRLGLLGFGWRDTTATQVYTVYDIYPFLVDEFIRRGAARSGLMWHFARPPIVELEYEVDTRG